MKSSQPPAMAIWLLVKCASGEKKESMIGDLVEQFHAGRPAGWFWWQAVIIIFGTFAVQTWGRRYFAAGVLVAGACFDSVFMTIVRPRWIYRFDAWFRYLHSWLLEHEMDRLRHLAFALELHMLTARLAYCALLAAVVWCLTRLKPPARGMVVMFFLMTQIALSVPGLRWSLVAWTGDLENYARFFSLVAYLTWTFVLIPSSIAFASRSSFSLR